MITKVMARARSGARASIAIMTCLSLPAIALAQATGLQVSGPPAAHAIEPKATKPGSSIELVRRALASNPGLAAARLDVDRARSRLRQAGLIPNPTFEVEQRTGRFTGADGEGETTVGVAVPLELFGQRARRIDLAEIEVEASEAAIAERERQLASQVRARCAEVLGARHELALIDELTSIDEATAKFVSVRVSEGESAPLELQLLKVEIDRRLSRRAVVEGRLEAAILELKVLTGAAEGEDLRLSEDLATAGWAGAPSSLGEAVRMAFDSRPDVRLARLEERAAQAGLRLIRAQTGPEVTAFSRFSVERSVFDDTPVGVIRDRDKTLSFGISISLPVFNRNQGARAEAETAVAQSTKLREYAEQRVRTEVAAAYARLKAADSAVATFEGGVIARTNETIRSVRGAYEIGAFSITELLAEQHRFADARSEYAGTLADRYQALSDLQSAMGVTAPFTERTPAAKPDVTAASRWAYPGVALDATPAPPGDPDGIVAPASRIGPRRRDSSEGRTDLTPIPDSTERTSAPGPK